jgi:hypothetical protein
MTQAFSGYSRPAAGLSKPQVEVLRKITTDSKFRKAFFSNPVAAVGKFNILISAEDLTPLAKLTPVQYEAIYSVIQRVSDDGDGTHTALYALAFAVVVALVLADQVLPDVSASQIGARGFENEKGGFSE